jgi:hypothetical protein
LSGASAFDNVKHRAAYGLHLRSLLFDGSRAGDNVDKLVAVDLARRLILTRLPDRRARAHQLAVQNVIEHRAAAQHDRWSIDRRCRHQTSRRGLVAAAINTTPSSG